MEPTYLETQGVPDHYDWRRRGGVNPIKNQGGCGSCWTFGTTAAIEGHLYIKTHKLLSLSEQQIVDCIPDHGCKGGNAGLAYKHLETIGQETESAYPYKAKKGGCRENKSLGKALVTKFNIVPHKNLS
jgi:C1A family cysteine protease